MQTTLLLLVKVVLLALLWFFVWMTIRAIRKDAQLVSGSRMVVASGAAGQNAGASGRAGRGSHAKPSSLSVITGPLTGTYLALQGYTEVTIGRSNSCTLVLEDDFASGAHARLFSRAGSWFIEDLDSRNGTWIGSQRLDQPERLGVGTEIRIGQTHIRMDA